MDTFDFDMIAQPNSNTYTVTQLTNRIKDLLESNFFSVELEGEISNYRPSSSGHVYFVIKDETSSISAALFKGKSRYLTFNPKDGMKVRVKGNISVYGARGTYQIIVDKMEELGTGDILKVLEERKRLFAQEGLFDSERKKHVPYFSPRIGVITSPTGAAIRDVLQIVKRRNSKVSVIVLPCAVQGVEAGNQIAAQINRANMFKLADVLIVGRGGGSLEDLLPFSEEAVVRAISNSTIPIISAVGHEIDWALSDFVADLRAPTPSAAAELAAPLLQEMYDRIDFSLAVRFIKEKVERLRILARSFSPENFELRLRTIEHPLLQRFDDAKDNLLISMEDKIIDFRHKLKYTHQVLEEANPHKILERGYSVVRKNESKKVIRSAKETAKGECLEVISFDGTYTTTVN